MCVCVCVCVCSVAQGADVCLFVCLSVSVYAVSPRVLPSLPASYQFGHGNHQRGRGAGAGRVPGGRRERMCVCVRVCVFQVGCEEDAEQGWIMCT